MWSIIHRAAQRDHDLKIAREKTAQAKEKTEQEKQLTAREVEREKTTQTKEKTAQEKERTTRAVKIKTLEREIEREKSIQEKQKTAQKQHEAKITSEREWTAQLKIFPDLIQEGVPVDEVTKLIQQHLSMTNHNKKPKK